MNERIQKLRELSVTTPVHIDLERAKIETDFYRENDGKYSIPVMRAMVLKEYFSKKTLYLGDGELIVGEKGKDPQASPTFPELCCHSVEDMTVMSERDLVSFHTTRRRQKLPGRRDHSVLEGKNYERETSGFHDSGMERLLRSRLCSQSLWSREDRDIHVVENRYLQQDIWTTKRRSKRQWMLLIL